MQVRKQTPKTQFKPKLMKIDIDGARAHLPMPKPFPQSQRYEKPSTSSNSIFGSTMNAFPLGTTQNLSNTYRARTRQGLEYGQSRDFDSKPYESENFFTRQNPVTSLMQHHQKYRTFLPSAAPSAREKVPLTKFAFDIKPDEGFARTIDKFESLLENRKSKRISTSGSLSARPFAQTSTRVSTRANTESEYGVPFKETIPVKRNTRYLQAPLENVSEFRRGTRPLGLRTEESFSSGYSGADAAELDAKMSKTFRLKKDITTKYKSDIQTKETEKKYASVKRLSNEELIRQNKDKLLVCVDNDEDITDTLKYCFVSRNIERDSDTKITKTGIEFNIKLDEIVKKLKISSKYKYLYLINGTPVFELAHIPPTENVIIISKQIELRSAEDIIQEDLVRDFYEYGTNKDIMIYSRSHIKSRLASFAQVQQMLEDKYNNVLQLFDGGEQLDSAELGRILKTEDSKRKKEYTGTISKFFNERASKNLTEESPARSQSTQRMNTVSDFKRDNVNENVNPEEGEEQEKVRTEEAEEEEEEEDEKTKQIKTYLKEKQPLSENKKFELYQQINRYYKGEIRKIKIGQEETDDNGDFEDELVEKEELKEGQRSPIEGMNIGENLDVLLKKWKSPRKKLDYFDIKKVISATTRKDISNHTRSRLQDELVINQYDNLIDAPTLREQGMAKNFILDNKKNLQKKKADILKLSKLNKELFLKNIPKNLEDKNLSRRELHYIYILYKALCEVTSQRHKEYKMGDGIDYHSFKNGIHQVFIQSDEVAEKIFYTIDCNFSGFLNWEEFIDAMVVIRAKTLRGKIDLFIKIADEDGNGSLSKDEIFKLAKICLKKFVTGGDESFLDSLCEYFTKLIFSSVGLNMDEEIPLQAIKEAIISGNPESDLLAMFCGADI